MKTRKPFLIALAVALLAIPVFAQQFHQAGADFWFLIQGAPAPSILVSGGGGLGLVPPPINGVGQDLGIQAGQGAGTAAAANVRIRGYVVGATSGTTPQAPPVDRLIIGTHVGMVTTISPPPVPTVTAACGTTPTVVGTDNSFQLNVGTGGSATSCTVTFNQPFLVKPICTVTDETSQAITTTAVPSTTTIVITGSAAWTASSILDVLCFGN